MLASGLAYMRKFREVVNEYIAALDEWEKQHISRLDGPNAFGELRNPAALTAAERQFMQARGELNWMIRRAQDITQSVGVAPTYHVLLSIVPDRNQNPFRYETQLNTHARLAVFDALT